MTVDVFRRHVSALQFTAWRPSFMVLHNTGAPNLQQGMSTPPAQRILNLERYYRDEQGWSSAPHAFVWPYPDGIWPFTPLIVRGTHSPSWNGTAIGIELIGDYSKDDPTTGDGLKVYQNAVAVFGIIHAKLGLDPSTIKFHREDPRTTHRCPGDKLWKMKGQFIEDVQEFMGTGGEHDDAVDETDPPPPPKVREGTVNVDLLNLRQESSASSRIIVELRKGQKVLISSEALNGSTTWYRVWCRVNGVERRGWVAARYITED